MAVTVPSTDGSYALILQTLIAALKVSTTVPAAYAADRIADYQEQLVRTLFQQQHLTAATVLSTIAYNSAAIPVVVIQAQINALNTVIASASASSAIGASDMLAQLDGLQRSMVEHLMEHGLMTADKILSTMTYLT
jgi:hypothetical protein